MSKSKEKEPRFEDAIGELESLIEKIESGQAGLEECLSHYERGMKLITQCQAVLAAAQKKIAELTTDAKGRLSVKDADAPESPESSDDPDDSADDTQARQAQG